MNTGTLKHQAKEYLDDYLEAYLRDGKIDDVRTPPPHFSQREEVQPVDYHKGRFMALTGNLPETRRQSQIAKIVTEQDNPIVLDIASYAGEYFGAFIAEQLSEAEVHVYNPLEERTNKDQRSIFAPEKEASYFHGKNVPETTNTKEFVEELFIQEGLENMTLHQEYCTSDHIKTHAQDNHDRNIIVYSARTLTVPFAIADAIKNNENTNAVFFPYLNKELDDTFIQEDMYAKHIPELRDHLQRQIQHKPTLKAEESAPGRLFSVLSLFYAASIADRVGGTVYKDDRRDNPSHVLHMPIYGVSTLEQTPL